MMMNQSPKIVFPAARGLCSRCIQKKHLLLAVAPSKPIVAVYCQHWRSAGWTFLDIDGQPKRWTIYTPIDSKEWVNILNSSISTTLRKQGIDPGDKKFLTLDRW